MEENLIKNAKVRAILEDTNLSKVMEEFLKDYAKDVDINKAKIRK